MNGSRKASLGNAKKLLESAEVLVTQVLDEEEECYESIPEECEDLDLFDEITDTVSQIEDVMDHISAAQEILELLTN